MARISREKVPAGRPIRGSGRWLGLLAVDDGCRSPCHLPPAMAVTRPLAGEVAAAGSKFTRPDPCIGWVLACSERAPVGDGAQALEWVGTETHEGVPKRSRRRRSAEDQPELVREARGCRHRRLRERQHLCHGGLSDALGASGRVPGGRRAGRRCAGGRGDDHPPWRRRAGGDAGPGTQATRTCSMRSLPAPPGSFPRICLPLV